MEQQALNAFELSTGMNTVWMIKEDFIDKSISNEHTYHFPVKIDLLGVVKQGDKHIINPFTDKVEVDSNNRCFYPTKQVCNNICEAMNTKSLRNAESFRDDLMQRADTLDNTVIKFYKEIQGKDLELIEDSE